VTLLRGIVDGALLRGGDRPPPAPVVVESSPAGMAYVCRRCDVYGYVGPEEPQVCWACESETDLERR
jgi:hypothetical protein